MLLLLFLFSFHLLQLLSLSVALPVEWPLCGGRRPTTPPKGAQLRLDALEDVNLRRQVNVPNAAALDEEVVDFGGGEQQLFARLGVDDHHLFC